jgi:hypothetical protein
MPCVTADKEITNSIPELQRNEAVRVYKERSKEGK